MIDLESLITKEDLARRLKVHPKTLEVWMRGGQLQCVRVGGRVRFEPEAVERFLRRESGPAEVPAQRRTSPEAMKILKDRGYLD
jgi:excisionase family DNA binding protein